MGYLLWAIYAFLATAASAHREHKVHNIVLYPEKHSWCKTTPIKQVVGHPGCAQTEVDNNVCVGACFSYSIPRTVPTAPGEVQPYCDSCQPSSVSWKDLVCEGEVGEMIKRVEVIEDCSCLNCPAPPQQTPKPGEEGGSPADVPQLLGLLHRANSTSHANLKHSERLSLLVKMLSEEGEGMGEVHDFISQVAGDDNAALEDQEEEDQVKLDLGKLRAYLSKLDTSHHHHRHHQHTQKTDDELQPTLDVLSHHLRPALEGEEITYLAEDHKTEADTNTQPPEQT